jgi:hypothetical protein
MDKGQPACKSKRYAKNQKRLKGNWYPNYVLERGERKGNKVEAMVLFVSRGFENVARIADR